VERPLEERVNAFKQLIKQGYSVRKALKEAGISHGTYTKLYGEIWSDPELQPFKPKLAIPKVGGSEVKGDKPPESKPEAKPETPPKPESKPEGGSMLDEILSEQMTPFEREFAELEKKRQTMIAAAYKVLSQYVEGYRPKATPPVQPAPQQTEATAPAPPQPGRDAIEDFLEAVKAYEEKRARVKEALERMGFELRDKSVLHSTDHMRAHSEVGGEKS
jgi:hypothetical protein